eukprot:m.234400 g.234400  ORF g.234400 m.234400 type:complete len:87 (+) comp40109_c0_seq25:161-421(+)
MKNIKIVVVGDAAVGKTCLFISYMTNAFPSGSVPKEFTDCLDDLMVDGKLICAWFFDTYEQEDYLPPRSLLYLDADVLLLCFSIAS